MEFAKREIKRPDPPVKVEDVQEEDALKKLEEASTGHHGERSGGCSQCGKNRPEFSPDDPKNSNSPKPSNIKRFMVVSISSEMFEYSDIKRIGMSLPIKWEDTFYEQKVRATLISYPISEVDGRTVIDEWVTALKDTHFKKPHFTVKSIPVYKSESESESESED
tara:strand:+ start:6360 stop:6851 length:492 start_codon:yes stop_codon:yes gene_type:complete